MASYAELTARIRRQQILKNQPAYYAGITLSTLVLLAVCLLALFRYPNPAAQVVNSAFFAFISTQLSFLVHDAGHGAIFSARWKNVLLGRLNAGLLLGMSFSWWCDDHNRHHRYPNQIGRDPNVAIPVLAFSEEQALEKRGLCRFAVKHQAYLFFPFSLLEAASKRRAALKFLLRRPNFLELIFFLSHYVIYFWLLLRALPLPVAILFAAVSEGLYGLYLSLVFAPNHKAMPILAQDSKLGFLERQIATARNVRVHRALDFLLGGANYQIEHHLFPRVPRNKFPEARNIVQAFCCSHAIPYQEMGFVETYRDVLRHLQHVSRVL
jgi:fatty acid desaturase